MSSTEESVDYNAMDHSAVNAQFVADLLAAEPDVSNILDLGTGTAQIPIELVRRSSTAFVTAVDAAASMLNVARLNLARAECNHRVSLALVDAKRLPYADHRFSAVISNSIVHHVPEPRTIFTEAVRICIANGVIFFRDLMRPANREALAKLVDTYATSNNEHQRQMFADSLHAALTLDEVRTIVAELGFSPSNVQATSDRHWTWRTRA